MINKSKLVASLGAIAFALAAGAASPAVAAGPYGQAYTGGGSAGYNHQVATDYRLKHHPKHHTTPSKAQ